MTPRLISAADAPRLATIHAEAFETPWSAQDIAEAFAGPGAFGFALESSGFILARVVADEAEVLTLAVSPSERRRGCAGVLLDAATVTALAAGANCMFLEVAEDNAAALALYERYGFIDVGRRSGYYARAGGAVAARVMRRDLNR